MPSNQHRETDLLQCMEVRGGHGNAANFFRRPGLDIWIWSQTRQDAVSEGGDMHYISSCASGRITRMLMADVGGIDNLFADVAERMRDLMKHNINVVAQKAAMRQLTAEMESTALRGGFTTTLLSTFFAPTRSLTICNAGHPLPLLYRASEGVWSTLKAEARQERPVAEISGTVPPGEYQRLKLKLETGDLVLCYGNALTTCRHRDGRTLGVLGLQHFIQQLSQTATGDNALSDLIEAIRKEHPDNLRDEDATVMLCKATQTHVAMRDNFLAPFRMLKGAIDRTNL